MIIKIVFKNLQNWFFKYNLFQLIEKNSIFKIVFFFFFLHKLINNLIQMNYHTESSIFYLTAESKFKSDFEC